MKRVAFLVARTNPNYGMCAMGRYAIVYKSCRGLAAFDPAKVEGGKRGFADFRMRC